MDGTTVRFLLMWITSFSVTESLYNAAIYKPTWESSLYFPSYLGNDGERKARNQTNFLCAHTYNDNPSWWMVDLKGQYVIEQVIFTNRDDDASAALKIHNFQIDVFRADPRQRPDFLIISGDVCFKRVEAVPIGTYTWQCQAPITGRFVRFIGYTNDHFHVCELEVMVSRALERFTKFSRYSGSILNTAITSSVRVATSQECVQQCVAFTNVSRCTAVNWFVSTHQCQLLSTDTRLTANIMSGLTSAQNVHFYMEV